ncbi:hypothetical protein QMK17_18385 [Rhodococcus sp. G-MC3]|nr:hypothetical protein [Rhodococcus sp. G-MC3]MDJ0395299.1 hypothetical protein [Rhodococcus sp. G-MC3]
MFSAEPAEKNPVGLVGSLSGAAAAVLMALSNPFIPESALHVAG